MCRKVKDRKKDLYSRTRPVLMREAANQPPSFTRMIFNT